MQHCLGDNCKHVHTTMHTQADCFLGNTYRTLSVLVVTNMLAAVVSENRKLKDSTRCLLDCPTDG
jgi:hypothetical protein